MLWLSVIFDKRSCDLYFFVSVLVDAVIYLKINDKEIILEYFLLWIEIQKKEEAYVATDKKVWKTEAIQYD